MDLERYDQMVQGVDSCVNYVERTDGGIKTYKSEYKIHAAHMKFTYYMEHKCAALARSSRDACGRPCVGGSRGAVAWRQSWWCR